MIENGADVNTEIIPKNDLLSGFIMSTKKAIEYAITNNDIKTILMLLKNGAKVKRSHLRIACENLNFKIIKILVENGVEINNNPEEIILEEILTCSNPLSVICSKVSTSKDGNDEIFNIAKYLIDNGADVNNESPLMAACSLEYGLTIDDPTKSFKILNANLNIIKLLVENGADVNYKDKFRNTCLHLIKDEWYHEKEIFEDSKGEFHTNKFDETNGEKILNLLLDNNADINVKNYMGMTALMQYALKGNAKLVKILLENGADITLKSEMTAFDLAGNEEIKKLIKDTKNNNPQKLVKLLSNFTIDKPIKYTTHIWDFGSLKNGEHKDFRGYMVAVKKQFDDIKSELEELSPNLYKKIYTFLIDENPDENYSWCNKGDINIGWSSLDGLKEHCDSGKNPFEFRLKKPIELDDGTRVRKFGEIIDLFKQEIEVRRDFKTLEKIFIDIGKSLDEDMILTTSKLDRQFYTDVQMLSNALNKIFDPIKKQKEYKNIEVSVSMSESDYYELKIVHIDSYSSQNSDELLKEVEDGDFADIKENLTNLCDWSVENSNKDKKYRINDRLKSILYNHIP